MTYMSHPLYYVPLAFLVMNSDEERLKLIGRAIAAERQRQGLSQGQLAIMIGQTDHAYISRLENGKQAPGITTFFELADALNVEVKYFFSEI